MVRPGHRNGHCPTTIKTTAGAVTIARTMLRGATEAFASRLFRHQRAPHPRPGDLATHGLRSPLLVISDDAFIERVFGETRRRVKVIGRFPGETSCTSMSWAVLDRAARG
ncbi:hypothetical protein ACWEPL_53970 [Nonomuraea sp. NPDC004186]